MTDAGREGWRDSVRAALDSVPDARQNRRRGAEAVTTDFLPGGYGAIVRAAKARRLSLAAYVRRAAYAMAAHDLGLPLSDLIDRDPRMSRDTGFAVEDPDGTKFGPWEIERLVDGQRT